MTVKKRNFCCGTDTGNCEHLARSGSQSEHRICIILNPCEITAVVLRYLKIHLKLLVLSNPINTDTGMTIGSVRIKRDILLKSKRHFLLEQNTKQIKEGINLHKAVIPRNKSTETVKNHPHISA